MVKRLLEGLPVVTVLLVALMGGTAMADPTEAEKTFDSLFGEDVSRVQATSDYQDDIDLAGVLLETTSATQDRSDLLKVLIDRTVMLASKHRSGYSVAEEALRYGMKQFPDQRVDYLTRLVDLRQKDFTQAPADQRTAAGEKLIKTLIEQSDASYDKYDFDNAMLPLRRATGIATAVKSAARDLIKTRMDRVLAGQLIAKQIQTARTRLAADKTDQAAATELLKLYVVEENNPEEARKYTFLVDGTDWPRNVKLATSDPTSLADQERFDMAEWYRLLSTEAHSDRAKAAMLARAMAYYDLYLASHTDEDLSRAKAELTQKRVKEDLAKVVAALPDIDRPQTGAYGASVNLLAMTDVRRDAMRGTWSLSTNGLTHDPADAVMIRLPVEPHGNYELTVKFTLTDTPGDAAMIYLPVRSTAVMLYAYYAEDEKLYHGLSMIDGAIVTDANNPTRTNGNPLSLGASHTAVIRVETEGDKARVSSMIDQKPFVEWSGPINKLDVYHKWRLRRTPGAVALAALNSGVIYEAVSIRMLDGELVSLVTPGDKTAPGAAPANGDNKGDSRDDQMERIMRGWKRMTPSQKNSLVLRLLKSNDPRIHDIGVQLERRLEGE
ncbi:MAG: hypothetical protein GC162_15610 [Planctomycetes bacterium]|nr:hypothetical protein [Planctomycetota bacterium]